MKEEIIVYIGGFELPDKNAAAHRVINNAKAFRTLGKHVVLIGVDKQLDGSCDIFSTYSVVDGFDTYAVPYPKNVKSWLKYLTSIKDYMAICEKQAKVNMVILYNFQAFAMQRMMSYCKKQNIKCCADVTEWRSTKGEKWFYRIIKGCDTWYRMRILHMNLDGMIVISRYLQNYYRKCKNVLYLPTLVDINEKKWKGEYKKSEQVLQLVYAGNPGHKDRIDVLVEALEKVSRKYKLDIIGITSKEYLQFYPHHKKIIEETKKITFHGRMIHSNALEYIKKANYSCFFRENDRVSKAGFPTKFAEAITCGTPVLTNDTSNIREYAKNGMDLLIVDNINVNKIAEKIETLKFQINVNRNIFDYHNFITEIEKFILNL